MMTPVAAPLGATNLCLARFFPPVSSRPGLPRPGLPRPVSTMPTQSVAEILKQVQRIQIMANRTVNALFVGHYKSVFRGRGMEFDEVRQYQPGDDVRAIDWNVTARTGDCFIKRFCEERELTVLFVVDISASGVFGSRWRSKLDVVIEIAAVLMFSALKNNDKVGLLTFCDDVVDFSPPRKGKSHVLRLVRRLVDVDPVHRETRLQPALEFLNRVQKRHAVVFLISDFLFDLPRRTLAVTRGRHDLTAITVSDPREHELPDVGFVVFRDSETGRLVEVDSRSRHVRRQFARSTLDRRHRLSQQFKRLGIDQLAVDTEHDYLIELQRFFRMREKRIR